MNTAVDIVAGTWTIDPGHSEVSFTVRHLMTKVRGRFERFIGTVETGERLADTTAHAVIELGSINTNSADRDAHLRSGDFFDVEHHDEMTFRSTSFDGSKATGELTIKGVTKTVELDVDFLGIESDPWGGRRIGFEATTQISRKEFGVDFNVPLDGGKLLVGDSVAITLEIQAVLQP